MPMKRAIEAGVGLKFGGHQRYPFMGPFLQRDLLDGDSFRPPQPQLVQLVHLINLINLIYLIYLVQSVQLLH
ncbi:hypothetical protein E4U53_006361 [Claviceps sorghi]|nr:hypothetical protein E4U53_006361 [Claviceps sorghi]